MSRRRDNGLKIVVKISGMKCPYVGTFGGKIRCASMLIRGKKKRTLRFHWNKYFSKKNLIFLESVGMSGKSPQTSTRLDEVE
jgi:hypothetical protein